MPQDCGNLEECGIMYFSLEEIVPKKAKTADRIDYEGHDSCCWSGDASTSPDK